MGASGLTRRGASASRGTHTPQPPLADGFLAQPYWWDAAPPGRPDGDDGPPAAADVVVVGSGYTGVSAALALARAGRSVLVLDQWQIGAGASTRNGGSVHAGVKAPARRLRRRLGRLAEELLADSVAAFAHVEQTIERERIDCDFRRLGHMELAHARTRAKALRRAAAAADDPEVRFLEPAQLVEEIGTDRFHGGLVHAHSGVLQPAKLHRGLVDAAAAAGVRFRERAQVLAIERGGGRLAVRTPAWTVAARQVLVATAGYVDGLLPRLARRVVPVGSWMIATTPLEPGLAARIADDGRAFLDTRRLLSYWRVVPDGRLVFGGRGSFRALPPEAARAALYRSMVSVYPELEGVPLTHAWGGTVGFTRDLIPHAGRDGEVYFSTGYCGSGVALSGYLGHRTAEWMAGGAPPSFAQMGFPLVPNVAGRPWYLPVVAAWYAVQDRMP